VTELFSDGQVGSTQETAGDFSAWTGTTGTPSVETTAPHHGSKDFKFDPAIYSAEYAYKDFAEVQTAYARLYVQAANFNDAPKVLELRDKDAQFYAQLLMASTGWTLYYRYYTFEYVQGSSTYTVTVNTGQQYCVEIKVIRSATVGEVRVYIDGIERITVTGINNAEGTGIDEVRVGVANTPFASGVIVYTDCVVVADAYIGVEGAGGGVTVKKGGGAMQATMGALLAGRLYG